MSFLRRRSPKTFRYAVPLVAVAIVGVLAGCSTSGDTADTEVADTAAFDQALFDMLPASVQESKTLSFGAVWETPPMIGVDVNDTDVPVGVAPDLAAALGEVLGVTAEWQNMQWPAQIPGLQSGNVDVLLGQVSITAERETGIVDLTPFFKSTMSILVPAGNPEDLDSIASACGLTLGGGVGSTISAMISAASDTYCVAEGKPAIEVAEYPGAQGAISAVQAGTIDGWIDSTSNQVLAAEANPDAFATVEVPAVESEVTDSGLLGIAVAKENPEISTALAEALKVLIENGTYGDILEEYNLSSEAISADEVVINMLSGTAVGVTS